MQIQDVSSRMPAQPSGAVNTPPPAPSEQAAPPPPEQTRPAPSDSGQTLDVKA